MIIAGFCIQFLGNLLLAWGLFTAWNRASGRASQWRKKVSQSWRELSARLSGSLWPRTSMCAESMAVMGWARRG